MKPNAFRRAATRGARDIATSERIDGRTPSGGDYSVIIFLDDKMDVVDSSVATKCVICEYANDGKLVSETFGICSQAQSEIR